MKDENVTVGPFKLEDTTHEESKDDSKVACRGLLKKFTLHVVTRWYRAPEIILM